MMTMNKDGNKQRVSAWQEAPMDAAGSQQATCAEPPSQHRAPSLSNHPAALALHTGVRQDLGGNFSART